jgi:D-serine deaminase-like pyridoxal phosphate-dependent protein
VSTRSTLRPVKARPHAKTHKCPVNALKQVELGTVGVCVQKVSEAEAMVYGGVTGKQTAISFQHCALVGKIGQIAGRRD